MGIHTFSCYRIPENCHYTYVVRNGNKLEEPSQPSENGYFNSGLLVLTPSEKQFNYLKTTLENLSSLQKYPFPDQDFLNEMYVGKWIRISYAYNALKTLRSAHSQMWDDQEIRGLHYVLKKPWADMNWPKLPEEERKKDPFYEVITWWFQAYEDMLENERNHSQLSQAN